MKTMLSVAVALTAVFLAQGCGSSGGGPGNDPAYMTSQAKLGADIAAMRTRTGGDYTKLTPAERDEFVKSFSGDEKAARAYWEGTMKGKTAEGRPAQMNK